jgi:hypothetical protein
VAQQRQPREKRGKRGMGRDRWLSMASPWRGAIGVIVEAHTQVLRSIVHVHNRLGPRGRSAINGMATASMATLLCSDACSSSRGAGPGRQCAKHGRDMRHQQLQCNYGAGAVEQPRRVVSVASRPVWCLSDSSDRGGHTTVRSQPGQGQAWPAHTQESACTQ